MTPARFIFTDDGVSVYFADGHHVTVYDYDPNYSALKDALRDKDWETARELATPARAIEKAIENVTDDVKIQHGIVYYNDQPLHMELTDRMLAMIDDDFDIKPLGIFLENLMENPSARAVNELFGFLQYGNMPITEDGCFLAYKRIKEDWTDCYSGKIDNSVGSIVSMPRNRVNDDKEQTCSTGLHFCSREYVQHFWGARMVVVKINPRDVVSIPVDYNNTKGRCCRYEVIAEIEEEFRLEASFMDTKDFWDDQDLYDPEDIDLDFFSDMPSPMDLLGANHPAFQPTGAQIEDLTDTPGYDGYVNPYRIKELDGWELEEAALSDVDELAGAGNSNEYWLGEVGPFRTRTDAELARVTANNIINED